MERVSLGGLQPSRTLAGFVAEVLAGSGESVTRLGEVIPAGGDHRVVYNGHLDLSW